MIKGIDDDTMEKVMYNLSLAVKDCEASKLLVDNGYINCQMSFAIEWIKPQEEPRGPTIKQVKMDRQQKFVSLVMQLKPILFTHPLVSVPPQKKVDLEKQVQLGRRIEELVHPLPPNEQSKLLQVAALIGDSLAEDSHTNMETAIQQAMALA
jgi:hypothetical protein